MSQLLEEEWLKPKFEAQRLWDGTLEALRKAPKGIIHLCEAIDLGTRVVEILTVQRLESVRDKFPATIASLLKAPPPEVEADRDFLHAPKWLRYIDVLDLLSGKQLSCISPQLHHGWEDKHSACHRVRAYTAEVTGISLGEKSRDDLILIGAYRNRIFRLPPPVRIIPNEVMGAYLTLINVVERLFGTPQNSI